MLVCLGFLIVGVRLLRREHVRGEKIRREEGGLETPIERERGWKGGRAEYFSKD